MPLRHTGEAYKGINHLLLSIETFAAGYMSPYWITYQQAKKMDAAVRKGERSSLIVFYGTAKKNGAADDPVAGEEGNGGEDHYRFLRGYRVFNADQVEGLPERFHPIEAEMDTGVRSAPEIDAFFAKMPFTIRGGFNHAAYREAGDEIVMPDASRFESVGAHAATLCHEGIHATGVECRLNRDWFARYHIDKENRAAEELVAELGSMMLTAHIGIGGEHIDNHAAYCNSWLKALKGDKRFIFKAAAEAQKACDWLLERGGRNDAAARSAAPAEAA